MNFPTYNFNGFPAAAWKMLNSKKISKRYLISKEITHSIIYNDEFHANVKRNQKDDQAFKLLAMAMEIFLKRHPRGKKLHDPLTACTAINPSIIKFLEVNCYQNKGA
ncbi:MAG: hypothetical protein ACTSWN_05760 [Promethearchaeota archaeon]